ncbi:hypothetical protein ABT124_40640 [Streptomyces sp. NPDC001982]|uniref:hypothetical protein n=1 Tax=Streptomyces sp. NPDC001982 TaxID=3154405 RepID=UPI003321BBEF
MKNDATALVLSVAQGACEIVKVGPDGKGPTLDGTARELLRATCLRKHSAGACWVMDWGVW